MNLQLIVVSTAALLTLLVCVVFVFSENFKTGLTGTLGYSMLGVGAFSYLAARLEATEVLSQHVSRTALLVWVGIALILSRMALNFFLKRRRKGPRWYDETKSSSNCSLS